MDEASQNFIASLDRAIDALAESFTSGKMTESKAAVFAVELHIANLAVPDANLGEIVRRVRAAWSALCLGADSKARVGGALRELGELRLYLENAWGPT